MDNMLSIFEAALTADGIQLIAILCILQYVQLCIYAYFMHMHGGMICISAYLHIMHIAHTAICEALMIANGENWTMSVTTKAEEK